MISIQSIVKMTLMMKQLRSFHQYYGNYWQTVNILKNQVNFKFKLMKDYNISLMGQVEHALLITI